MYVYRGKNREPDEQQSTDGRKRKVKPCGTDAAYQRHKKRGEEACDPCKDAHANRVAKDRRAAHKKRHRSPKPICGTYSAAVQHRKKGEPVDLACRRAEAEYHAARRARKKQAA